MPGDGRRGAVEQSNIVRSRNCIEEIVIDCGVYEFLRAERTHIIGSGDGKRLGIILAAVFENLIFNFRNNDRRLITFAGQSECRIAAFGRSSDAPEGEADIGDIAAVEEVAAGAE